MGTIRICYEDYPRTGLKKRKVYKWLRKVIEGENSTFASITIIFCSDKYLLELNKKYLKHDYYTDIVTFNYSEKGIISGDLFISMERVKENALKYNVKFEEEAIRVIAHGTLHLMNYDDRSGSEKKLMREKEDFYIHEYKIIE